MSVDNSNAYLFMLFKALWHLILNAVLSLIHIVTEMSNYNGKIKKKKIKNYERRVGAKCRKEGGRQGSGTEAE